MASLDCNRAVFEAVALPHLASLYRFALTLTGDANDAEDLVQDTYVRALQFFHRFESGTNCKAWLLTMMKRIFLNQAPHRGREILDPEPNAQTGTRSRGWTDSCVSAWVNAGEVDLEEHEVFRQDIVRALDLVPEAFRIVVLLRDLEGFSYAEIAQLLDCPMGTVMSRLSRGRNLLREFLRVYAIPDRNPAEMNR